MSCWCFFSSGGRFGREGENPLPVWCISFSSGGWFGREGENPLPVWCIFFSFFFFWSFLQRPWGLVCGVEEALVVFVVEEAQFYSFMYPTFIGKGKPILFSMYV